MCFQEVVGLKDLESVRDSFHEDFIDQLKILEDVPTARNCLGNRIMPLFLQTRNWQLGD